MSMSCSRYSSLKLIKIIYGFWILFGSSFCAKNGLLKSNEICNTDPCYQAANKIIKNMDDTIDPCDDFYTYVCGGWIRSNSLPGDKNFYGIFSKTQDKVDHKLRDILNEPNFDDDPEPVIAARLMFNSCNNQQYLDQRGVKPLRRMLRSIGGWPLINDDFNEADYNWQDALTILLSYRLDILIALSVDPSQTDSSINAVKFDVPSFGVAPPEFATYRSDPAAKRIIDAYKNYVIGVAILLKGENSGKMDSMADELIAFESTLTQSSGPPDYIRISFRDLNDQIQDVNWLNIINGIYTQLNLDIQLTEDDSIETYQLNYIKALSSLIVATKPETIANYLGWRALQITGYMGPSMFTDYELELDKVTQGLATKMPLWRRCLAFVKDNFVYAVSRPYIIENYSATKEGEVALLTQTILRSFKNVLKDCKWIDDKMKIRSWEVLDNVTIHIGFPHWILDDKELEDYYQIEYNLDIEKAFENSFIVRSNINKVKLSLINSPVDIEKSWPLNPVEINAFYGDNLRTLTISAAIQTAPFFKVGLPSYLNYGGLGSTIGHEITHLFTSHTGKPTTPEPTVRESLGYFSRAADSTFKKKSECFVEEYSTVLDDRVNLYVDGNRTLDENLADNGGIPLSFESYKRHIELEGPDPSLPGLESFSAEQLFFIAFATPFCSLANREGIRDRMLNDVHTLGQYRVNVLLSNYKEFGDAFQCKTGDNMMPENSCNLWGNTKNGY